MSEFLPPIVLPLEGKMGDLLKTLAEADTAIQTFAAKEKRNLREAGEDSGEEFSDGLERGMRRHRVGGGGGGGGGGMFGGLLTGLMGAALPTAITGLVYGAAQAIAALAPVAGLAAAMPAAIGALVVALSTLKMAFKGVGTAISAGVSGDLEKYNEALQKLAPAAQEATKAFVSLHPLMKSMQQTVQQNFWTGLGKDIRLIGQQYLPMMRTELGELATAFNGVARWITDWLKIPDVFKSIASWLTNIRFGLANAAPGFQSIISGLNDLMTAGSRFFPQWGLGFTTLADRFSEFAARVSSNGQLEEWIQGGVDALKLLGPLLKDAWGVLHPIIQALNATNTGGGLGFLGTALHQLSEFLNSTQGTELLVSLFTILNDVMSVLGHTLGALLPVVGQLLVTLVPLFDALAGVSPEIIDQLAKSLTEMIIAWAPAVPVLAELTTELLPVLVPLIKLLGDVLVFTMPSTKMWAQYILELVRAFKSLVGGLHSGRSAIQGVGGWFTNMGHQIMGVLKALPGMLAHGALEAMRAFAYAIGFGLGLATKWFVSWLSVVWDVIKLLGTQGQKLIAETITHWVRFFIEFPPKVWNALKGLPGLILSIWAGANKWLFDAGVALLEGLVKGIMSMWKKSIDLVVDLGHSLVDGFRRAVGWHSPSTVFMAGGAAIVAGLVKGITDNAGSAVRAAAGLLDGVGGVTLGLGLAGAGGGAGRLVGVGRGGRGGGEPVVHVINRVYLDGKQIHERLIQPSQRYKRRTGTTGLS